jgi:uncharacterized damage-inducible protein DinB
MANTNFLTESLSAWRHDRQGLIDEVENIRATKFDFRPTPEVRSVRELVQHILEVAMMMTGELTQPKPDFSRATYPAFLEMYSQSVYDAQTKKELITMLEWQIDDAVKRFKKVGEAAMFELVTNFDGSKWTRMQWLHHGLAQEMYHRGQITTYERLMGLEPALTTRIRGAGG